MSGMDIVIGELTDDHVQSAVNIDKMCFREPWSARRFRDTRYRTSRHGGRWLVTGAYIEGKLAGYMVSSPLTKAWQIQRLAVYSLARRKGVATKLVDTLLGLLSEDGRRTVLMLIPEHATQALRFAENRGFKRAAYVNRLITMSWRLRNSAPVEEYIFGDRELEA